MEIFLSYCWSNKVEADIIDTFISSVGITVIRDVRDLEYRENLRSFMSQIRKADFAIIVISNDYLKSPNCLYELIELSKEQSFINKFIPILVEEPKIYSIENKTDLLRHWGNKINITKSLLKDIEATKSISLIKELKHYETIYSELDYLLSIITEYKNFTLPEVQKTAFKELIKFMGLDDPNLKEEIGRVQLIEDHELQDLELEKLKQKYRDNEDLIFAEAYVNLTQRKNYKKAKFYFHLYLDKHQDSATYNNIGLTYYNLGETSEAIQFYLKGLKLNEKSPQLYFNLGFAYIKEGKPNLAIESLSSSLSIYPENADCLYNLGFAYSEMLGNHNKGLEFYLKAIDLNPEIKQAYNNIAVIYIRKKEYDNAINYINKGLELNLNDPVAMYNLGVIYTLKGDIKRAKLMYRKSIRESPLYCSPKIGLAKLLLNSNGDRDEALELLRDVLKIDPNETDASIIMKYLENNI